MSVAAAETRDATKQEQIGGPDGPADQEQVCELLRCSARMLDRWWALWCERGVDVGEVKVRPKLRFRREKVEALAAAPKMRL